MSAAITKPPPIVLGILAIGALWWLSQRRAVAGGLATSRTGTPIYGTEGALRNSAAQRYLVPVSGTVPVVGGARGQASQQLTLAQSGLNLVAQLFRNGGNKAAPGAPLVTTPANAYGFDAVQPGLSNAVSAYSFGGPSMGVYGSTGSDIANGFALGPNAAYYGKITSPGTFTGDPYNDGGGYYDTVIANPAPNLDWDDAPGTWLNNPL